MLNFLIGVAGGLIYTAFIGSIVWIAHRRGNEHESPMRIPVIHHGDGSDMVDSNHQPFIEGDLKMITKNSVKDIFRHLQSAAEKMPADCLITVQIQSHNITHRFSVQNSELGHIESHDSSSVAHLEEEEQEKLRMFRTREHVMRYAD